jgi:hypothetical protein
VSAGHDAQLDEASLLVTVDRCRAWVMSDAHDLPEAAAIEAELDRHVARVRSVLDLVNGASPPLTAPGSAGTAPPPSREPPAPAAPPEEPAAPAPQRTGARAPGNRSTLWSHEYADQQHACVLVTGASGVAVELHVDDSVLESRACQTLDEAFEQSTAWKRTYLPAAILTLPDIPR